MTLLQDKWKEAKDNGEKYFFTGEPCRRGHIADRYTSRGACVACSRDEQVKYRKANLGKAAAIQQGVRDRHEDYPKFIREYKNAYYKTPHGNERCRLATLRCKYKGLDDDTLLRDSKIRIQVSKLGTERRAVLDTMKIEARMLRDEGSNELKIIADKYRKKKLALRQQKQEYNALIDEMIEQLKGELSYYER